ncbi:MAG: zinc-dependent alcohol dehydrogenase [Candidatus Zipacnadales bacterium]
MKGLRYYGGDDLRLEELPEPKPAPNELLIEIKAVGICRTDVEIVEGLHPFYADKGPDQPFVLGHEWSGIVRELGEEVQGFEVGQLVTGETGLGCGECDLCRIQQHNACPHRVETGVFGRDGGMRELHVHPAHFTYSAEGLSPEEAAMVEPASVGVYATKRADVRPGDRVAVLGGGSIGLMVMQAAKAFGAEEVVLATRSPEKRALAETLGADETFDAGADDFVEQMTDHTGGDLYHVIIEATGDVRSIREAIQLVRPRGRIVVLGVFDQPLVQTLGIIVSKEISILGSVGSPGVWPLTISLMRRGRIHAKPLLSGIFPFENYREAFETVSKGGPQIVKCLLVP